jgi:predicted DNA-binding protein
VTYLDKDKSITVSIRLPQKLHEQLTFKAQQEHSDFSKYCRRLLEKGVSLEAYKEDIDFITKIIRNELENVIDPYANRQIKMLMKIGKATGGTMFTTIKLLLSLINLDKLYTFKELLENSMKLGVEYMKMKDFEVDQYLADGEKMIEKSGRL